MADKTKGELLKEELFYERKNMLESKNGIENLISCFPTLPFVKSCLNLSDTLLVLL